MSTLKLKTSAGGSISLTPTDTASDVTLVLPTSSLIDSETLAASGGADLVGFLPTGTISSVTVQGAIDEVVSDLASSSGSGYVGYLPAGTSAAPTTVQNKLRQTVNVKDFGAVGDGVTDDTAAIQLAINYVQAITTNHVELLFEAKAYRCLGTLTVSGSCRMIGEGYLDFIDWDPTRPQKGTWLIHASATGSLFTFSGGDSRGSGLTNIAIYQEGHPTPGAGWAPASRDWVIRNVGSNGTLILDRVHFHGVYQGVLTDFAARPHYENITGQFFYRAFSYDRIYDLGKLEGLHAWTYWSENNYVLQWQQTNCVSITLLRVDGMWFDRIFTFAVAVSMFVDDSAYGGTAKVIYVHGLYSDFCGRAIVVDAISPAHLQVGSMFHLGQAWPGTTPATVLPGAASIDVTSGSNHLIQVSNLYDTLAETHAIRVAGTSNTVWIGSAVFESYSRGSAGNGAVTASAGNTIRFGSVPLLNPYAGGATTLFNGTPGGTAFEPTRQVITTATVNYPVTSGNVSGQLAAYTAEGEATAGVALVAKTTGTVNVGAPTNLLGFYGSAATAKQTGVPVTAAGIHAALVALGLIS